MSENLARIMTTAAEENPDGISVKLDDTELSFGLLEEGSARMAAILSDKGVKAGDRVGIMLPNVPYFPVAYYGVLRLGGIVVPMNPLLKGREVKFYLEDPGANVLIAWHGFEEPATQGAEEAGAELILVEPGEFEKLLGEVEEPLHVLEDRDADDTAVILYTSGTTGQPKGAELTHSNLYKNCTVAADHLGEISKDDRLLGALPLFHSFGQTCTLNGAVHAQAMVSMIPRFDPEKALEIIERDKITLFQGVPTMYNGMLHASNKDDVDTSTLQGLHVRRVGDARGGHARLREAVRLQGPGGLRPVRDLPGRLVQPPRQGEQGGLDRHPHRGRRDEAGGRRRQRGRATARSARSSSRATTS